jgi:hypothetical protein
MLVFIIGGRYLKVVVISGLTVYQHDYSDQSQLLLPNLTVIPLNTETYMQSGTDGPHFMRSFYIYAQSSIFVIGNIR